MKSRALKITGFLVAGVGIITLAYAAFIIGILLIKNGWICFEKNLLSIIFPFIVLILLTLGLYDFYCKLREYESSPDFLKEDFLKGNPLLAKIFKLMGG